jgi:molecular chaperone GrpE
MTPNEQDQATQAMPPAHEDADAAELRSSIAAAEARAAESKDLYMRALAEIENVRKRSARDIEQAHKYAVERFAGDLVAVKDSLELGLDAQGASEESLRAGMEATLKQLAKAFERAGIVEVDPRGETFNPELHEAMATQPSPEYPPNAVLQVVQKGYVLNGRLLRAARVIVARQP